MSENDEKIENGKKTGVVVNLQEWLKRDERVRKATVVSEGGEFSKRGFMDCLDREAADKSSKDAAQRQIDERWRRYAPWYSIVALVSLVLMVVVRRSHLSQPFKFIILEIILYGVFLSSLLLLVLRRKCIAKIVKDVRDSLS